MSPEERLGQAREEVLELVERAAETVEFLRHSLTSNTPQATLPTEWSRDLQHITNRLQVAITRLDVLGGHGGLP